MVIKSYIITDKHFHFLLAFAVERNVSQGLKAISYRLGKDYNPGRIYPCIKELNEWGLIERTNPGAPRVSGHKYKISLQGCAVIEEYMERLKAVSIPQPEFGF